MSPKLSKTLVLTAAFACLLTAVGVSAETTAGNGATGAAGSSGDHTEMDADSSASSAFPPNGTGVEGSEEGDHCPGYRPGNPQQSEETENCAAGAGIGVVDHVQAFGMGSHVRSPNWTACGIPVLPNEKYAHYKRSLYLARFELYILACAIQGYGIGSGPYCLDSRWSPLKGLWSPPLYRLGQYDSRGL